MSDQYIMNDYLLVLKSTVEVYVHGTLESSNEDSREVLKSHLDKIMDAQARTYDKMVECGWYNVKNVNGSEIEKTYDKVNKN